MGGVYKNLLLTLLIDSQLTSGEFYYTALNICCILAPSTDQLPFPSCRKAFPQHDAAFAMCHHWNCSLICTVRQKTFLNSSDLQVLHIFALPCHQMINSLNQSINSSPNTMSFVFLLIHLFYCVLSWSLEWNPNKIVTFGSGIHHPHGNHKK